MALTRPNKVLDAVAFGSMRSYSSADVPASFVDSIIALGLSARYRPCRSSLEKSCHLSITKEPSRAPQSDAIQLDMETWVAERLFVFLLTLLF